MDSASDLAQPRSLQLMVIEDDPVFRLGLVTGLNQTPGMQVVLEAESSQIALQQLATWVASQSEPTGAIALDGIILSLDLERSTSGSREGAALCQQLKAQYPHLPILSLSAQPSAVQLAAALQAGVEGFCFKGSELATLIAAIRRVAAGQVEWSQGMQQLAQALTTTAAIAPSISTLPAPAARPHLLATLRQRLHQSSVQQIEAAIAAINDTLQAELPLIDQVFLTGRRRELRAARWLVNRLLASGERATHRPEIPPPPRAVPAPPEISPPGVSPTVRVSLSPQTAGSLRSIQAALFDATATKLQSKLYNLTAHPLEIDILKPEKRRELLYIILRKLEDILADLRFAQVPLDQLAEKQSLILVDLWQAATSEFFGKYYTLWVDDRDVALVDRLLQDQAIVQTAMLEKIPLVQAFLAHLLFQVPLGIDDAAYAVGTVEAMARMELLLDNLILQVANAVMQPLLNRFGDVVVIKQNFYDQRLLSSREIERFRNDLSWKYRLAQWIHEPTAIFESRFTLLTLLDTGISQVSIYAPRNQELDALAGVPYAVTLALEARDAIAPRLRSAISFLGSGMVYVLTEVIGRGIGLIGRGIVKGIGNAFQDTKFSRNGERSR